VHQHLNSSPDSLFLIILLFDIVPNQSASSLANVKAEMAAWGTPFMLEDGHVMKNEGVESGAVENLEARRGKDSEQLAD